MTTHAALKLFTPFTREAIKDAGFQLECLSQVNLKTLRKNILLDSGSVFVDALVRKFLMTKVITLTQDFHGKCG